MKRQIILRREELHLNPRETKWQISSAHEKKSIANISLKFKLGPLIIPDEVHSRANSFANNSDKLKYIYMKGTEKI